MTTKQSAPRRARRPPSQLPVPLAVRACETTTTVLVLVVAPVTRCHESRIIPNPTRIVATSTKVYYGTSSASGSTTTVVVVLAVVASTISTSTSTGTGSSSSSLSTTQAVWAVHFPSSLDTCERVRVY